MKYHDGYSENDFEILLVLLGNLKGRFVLSSYPSDILSGYAEKNGWKQISFKTKVSVATVDNPMKTEVISMNFSPDNNV